MASIWIMSFEEPEYTSVNRCSIMGGERDSEGSGTREHRVDKMAERVNSG